ncbi:MAG: hypothetical protein J6112_06375 [Clostridia bacterium]|nr:hypothetical protein [Clostridia bacterium]
MNENEKNGLNPETDQAVDEPNNMSRAESLKILGLPENASDDAVKFRYGALLRQYKKKIDEYGTTYEDLEYYKSITSAYDNVFGYSHDFTDDDPTSPIPYKYRRKYGKFLTWLEQYRLIVMLGVVIIILAVVFIVQNVGRNKVDLKVKFVGAYTQSLYENLSDQMNKKSKVFGNVQITFFTVTTDTTMLDAQARTQAEAFYSQLMADGQLDVVLIDKESFDVYVKQYAFLPLDELIEAYGSEHGNAFLLDTYSYATYPDSEGKIVVPQGIYGVDVTSSTFFNDCTALEWLYDSAKGQEKTMIFAIARHSNAVDKSAEFLYELLDSRQLP